MLTEKGMDAEQADALSKLFKARAKVASKWASSPMEWFNNLGLQFNNATQQENKTVLNGSVTYEQGGKHTEKLNKIKEKGNSLQLTNVSEFDKIEEFYNKSKENLLNEKRIEFKKLGLSEKEIQKRISFN